jgi:hypothetical protein
MIVQSAMNPLRFSGVVAAEPSIGAEYHLTARVAYEAALTMPLEALKRDGGYTAVLLPAAWIGLSLGL